jgi:hypothetical protein
VAIAIVYKICREHGVYAKTKAELAKLSQQLASGGAANIPAYMLDPKAGSGYVGSLLVVAVAAIVTASFCFVLVCR